MLRALDGDAEAIDALVRALAPAVHARVVRTLSRFPSRGRSTRQEVEDLCQEAFAALFADDAKCLRSWDPARGLSLEAFAAFVAERRVYSILRSSRRSPWTEEPVSEVDLDGRGPGVDPEPAVASRQLLERVLDRLRAELTPLGLSLFSSLVVEQLSVEEVRARHRMGANAVYAWRSRLIKRMRALAIELSREDGEAGR